MSERGRTIFLVFLWLFVGLLIGCAIGKVWGTNVGYDNAKNDLPQCGKDDYLYPAEQRSGEWLDAMSRSYYVEPQPAFRAPGAAKPSDYACFPFEPESIRFITVTADGPAECYVRYDVVQRELTNLGCTPADEETKP